MDSIEVKLSSGITNVDRDRIRDIVRDAIAEHVHSRQGVIKNLNLRAMVTECAIGDRLAQFAISVEGDVNGKQLAREVRADRTLIKLPDPTAGTKHGLPSLVSQGIIDLGVRTVGLGDNAVSLSQCIAECVAELSLTIDSLIGHRESAASTTWKRIAIARWIVAIAVVPLVAVVFVLSTGADGFWVFMSAIIVALSVFWLIHVVGLAFMPASFFHNDPHGKKAMARAGIASIVALRVVCVLLSVILLAVLVGCVKASIDSIPKAPPNAR